MDKQDKQGENHEYKSPGILQESTEFEARKPRVHGEIQLSIRYFTKVHFSSINIYVIALNNPRHMVCIETLNSL